MPSFYSYIDSLSYAWAGNVTDQYYSPIESDYHSFNYPDKFGFLVLDDITSLRGATINTCYVRMNQRFYNMSGSPDYFTIRVKFEKVANPTIWSTSASPQSYATAFGSRTYTTSYVDWTYSSQALNSDVQSPNLASVLQEVINAYPTTLTGVHAHCEFIFGQSAGSTNVELRLSAANLYVDYSLASSKPNFFLQGN